MKSRMMSTRKARSRGQVFIEFCMGLTFVLLPLILGVLQYGILIKTTLALNNLSREVGRYSAVNARKANADTLIKDFAIATAAPLKLNITAANVAITTTQKNGTPTPAGTVSTSREQYGNITVVITYNAKDNGRVFLPKIFTGSGLFSSKSVMVMQTP